MSMILEAGTYRGGIQEHAVSMTKNSGLPQFEVKLQAVEKYDFETAEWQKHESDACEITGFLILIGKNGEPTFHIDDVKRVCEWDGRSLVELDQADLAGLAIQFRVIEDVYDGKTRLKVAAIGEFDDTPGTGGVRKMDPEDVKALDAKFAAALNKMSGGAKPVSAKKPAAAKPAAPKATVKEKDKAASEPEAEAEAPVPPAAKTPPKPPAIKTAPAPVKELSYEDAWAKCYEMKSKQTTDDELAAAFSAAVQRVAPDAEMEAITGAQWAQIADAVIAEHGVFA